MKPILSRALGSLALASALLVGAPASPASAADCSATKTSSDSHTFSTSRWVQVNAYVHYRHCVGVGGNHWVDPISYTLSYNMEGTSYDCAWYSWFEGVTFNGYFWDGSGTNWNPGAKDAPCKTNTHWENTYSMAYAPNFVRCGSILPKWKFNVTLRKNAETDAHATLSGTWWGFTGPVPDNCN